MSSISSCPGNILRVVRGEDIGSLVTAEEGSLRQELKDIEKRMTDAVGALKERFKTLRTGRANLGMLDGILVSAYGADVPINQVANLSVPEPTLIVAAPWDPKIAVEIERAVRKSELGLNPQNDGKVVRIPIPR